MLYASSLGSLALPENPCVVKRRLKVPGHHAESSHPVREELIMGDVISDFATDRDAFAQKCKADLALTRKVLAAVLANPETKLVFHSELEKQSATTYVHEGLNLSSTTFYSYNLKPIEQRLSLSVNSSGGGLPPGSGAGSSQLVLLGYNGDWSGLLPGGGQVAQDPAHRRARDGADSGHLRHPVGAADPGGAAGAVVRFTGAATARRFPRKSSLSRFPAHRGFRSSRAPDRRSGTASRCRTAGGPLPGCRAARRSHCRVRR